MALAVSPFCDTVANVERSQISKASSSTNRQQASGDKTYAGRLTRPIVVCKSSQSDNRLDSPLHAELPLVGILIHAGV